MRDAHGMVGVYFEVAAAIIALVLLGEWLELAARGRTSAAIRQLLGLAPKTARRVRADGTEEDVALEALVRRRPRARAPRREGAGRRPRRRRPLERSMNRCSRASRCRSTRARAIASSAPRSIRRVRCWSSPSAWARTACCRRSSTLVAQAQRSRAPLQRLADRVSAWFVPAVMLIAVATFVVWWFVGPEPRLAYALVNAVAVLIIACPCALGLATPISIMVASGRGAQMGVLFRDAQAIESLREIDTLVVDKTGTLTVGGRRCTR